MLFCEPSQLSFSDMIILSSFSYCQSISFPHRDSDIFHSVHLLKLVLRAALRLLAIIIIIIWSRLKNNSLAFERFYDILLAITTVEQSIIKTITFLK